MALPSLVNNNQINFERMFAECPSAPGDYINDWLNSGWCGETNLDLILTYAIEEGASDINIVGGQQVSFIILGDLIKKPQFAIPDEDTMMDIVMGMLSHQDMGVYVKELEYDFSYKIRFGPHKGKRFRANLGKSLGLDQITFRTISDTIPSKVNYLIVHQVSH